MRADMRGPMALLVWAPVLVTAVMMVQARDPHFLLSCSLVKEES